MLVTASGTLQDAIGGTFTVDFFNDPTNTQGGGTPFDTPGNEVAHFSFTATTIADSFSFTQSVPLLFPDTGPFSMTVITTYTLPVGGVFLSRAIDAEAGVVPEPSTWVMMLLGFAGLGFAGDPPQGQGSIGRDGDLTRPSLPKAKGRRETKVPDNNSLCSCIINHIIQCVIVYYLRLCVMNPTHGT